MKRLIVLLLAVLAPWPVLAGLDIPVLTWTPRSDWLNVRNAPYNAKGNGIDDDTVAIQAALTAAGAAHSTTTTVYLPPGTYKISSTLNWQGSNVNWTGVQGVALVGCGRATIVRWAGTSGGAMFLSNGVTRVRYTGISWDGANLAGAAYTHISTNLYESRMRHENEAFRNFTVSGTYVAGKTYPAAAIITGLASETEATAETMIWNCFFGNCTYGVIVGYEEFNSYQWFIEGCEFEGCGTGISAPDGKTIIYNDHFEGSTVADIATTAGLDQTVSRCTSHGSNQFFTVAFGGSATPQVLEDCWIDSWKSTTTAVEVDSRGPTLIFDCVFTNPPNTAPPIRLSNSPSDPARLLLSNDYFPPTVTAPVAPGSASTTVTIPPGSLGGMVTSLSSPSATFLQITQPPDSANIIDVTQPPYNAAKNNTTDATSAIQNAINAAAVANNGSIVYLPIGTYKVSSTLSVTGSNYTIQGSGNQSIISWAGSENGTVMNVTSPQNLELSQFQIYGDTTITAVEHTAATAGTMIYDGLYYSNYNNYNLDGPGVQLSLLPAGCEVLFEHLDAPLTLSDCGAAEILGKFVLQGQLIVGGATQPRTGFFGITDFQGGQMTANSAYWDVTVNDNQNLTIEHYYQEQGYNHLEVNRGAGTTSGQVAIMGVKQNLTAPYVSIQVNNYNGRVFYGPQAFANTDSTIINQSGANAVDLILAGDTFMNVSPTMTLDTGANLIQTANIYTTSPSYTYPTDVLPTGALASIAAGLDNFRKIAGEDARLHYGIENTVSNSFFETDAANTSPYTTLGSAPASWNVSNAVTAGSGVRTVSVANTGSPFGPGAQSARLVDSTQTTAGSALGFSQNTLTLAASTGAVLNFDVRLNSMAALNDNIAVSVAAGSGTAFSANLAGNTTSGSFGPAPLALNTWYRIRAVIQPPALGAETVTIHVTPWTATGPGTTSTYAATGSLSGPVSAGLSAVQFLASATGSMDVQFDNITLVSGDPLLNTDSETAWKLQNFTAAQLANSNVSGDQASPAGDGVTNLMKYALNLSPGTYDTAPLLGSGSTTIDGAPYLTMNFARNNAASDVSYVWQQSSDLKSWTTISPNLLNAAAVNASTELDTYAMPASAGNTFFRLEITKP